MLEITTDRLILREPVPDDAEPLLRAVFADPVAMRYIGDGKPRDIEKVRFSVDRKINTLRDHGVTVFTLLRRDTGEIIGDCGACPIAWKGPEFELGYRLAVSAWGQGFATEAARAARDFFWTTTNEPYVLGVTDLRNDASMRVLLKLGFDDLGTSDKYYDETLRLFRLDRPT